MTNHMESPIPLSDIESVLAWVDTFKLSRVTKKINRDFSDAVLLAEILSVYYPKLVEMHNYPPRNSHSLKLNNWMTLNRKVLKKLKLGLCCNTMEQLANCVPGVIERVLVMVREKIRRDEEANKKEENANVSSGGSYYETCGDEDHVLVVPVKVRINGVLETVQQKVVNYETFNALKMELKDAVDAAEVLKQKVEHLDNMIKLKEERIDELQNQLERKQARRKEAEIQQNSLSVPFDSVATSPHASFECCIPVVKTSSLKTVNSKLKFDDSKIKLDESNTKLEETKIKIVDSMENDLNSISSLKTMSKPSITDVYDVEPNINDNVKIEKKSSHVFKGEFIEEKSDYSPDYDEFKDSEQDCPMTIENTIQREIKDLIKTNEYVQELNANTMD